MKSVKRLLTVVPLMAMLLSACSNNRATEVGDPNSDFYLALPRIELQVNNDGVLSLPNVDPKLFALVTGGQFDITQYRLDPSYVEWLKSTNTQHMEIVHKGDGLFLFVNNKPMPHIRWNNESIANLGNTAADMSVKLAPSFGMQMDERTAKTIKLLAPFIQRLGVDVALKLPLKDGATPIELRPAGGKIDAMENPAGDALLKTRVVVNYGADGVPSIAGLSATDADALLSGFGVSLSGLNLDPALIKNMTDLGVQHLSLKTDKDGILLAVNDKQLPSIVWNEEMLNNTTETFTSLNTYPEFAAYNDIVKIVVPQIKNGDVELALRFPLAPGAKAVPINFGVN